MRLSLDSLAKVAPGVARPSYDPGNVGIGIVHLGIGAFHRAHQAIYTDAALTHAGGNWGICGVSLRSADVRDRMVPQDGLYTAVVKGAEGVARRVVGSVREVLFLGDQRERINARLADPATRIVTLTVTEKGYCHDPATGWLNFAHPDIVHDLKFRAKPVTAVGLLASALAARRDTEAGPLTIVCCDNLPRNGEVLRGIVMAFAHAIDATLARWIATHVAFPSTMVDRIVPATMPEDVADNDVAVGLHDAAPVVCEPFSQWVIEDAFVTRRPAWERGGAQWVTDVAPFEVMKLRLLNASHSAFAYLGFLAGHDSIYEVAKAPHFAAYMRRLMQEEIAPTIAVPPGVDLDAYQDALVARFANPSLPHRTQQIAMDGSQKLPQRILDMARENLAAGRPIPMTTLAVAAWMRYVSGIDESGRAIKVSDPLAADLAAIAAVARDNPAALAQGLLEVRAIFGDDLAHNPRFAAPVAEWLAALYSDGAARVVARAAGSGSAMNF